MREARSGHCITSLKYGSGGGRRCAEKRSIKYNIQMKGNIINQELINATEKRREKAEAYKEGGYEWDREKQSQILY